MKESGPLGGVRRLRPWNRQWENIEGGHHFQNKLGQLQVMQVIYFHADSSRQPGILIALWTDSKYIIFV